MNTNTGAINTHTIAIHNPKSCHGCKHSSRGRWSGWACANGVPGDVDDYSCHETDADVNFWESIDGDK